ncbi:CocE/NonD family hydrolase [Actinomadura rupiterrae]|uniref:CocE/NonD family hydrolase n=1 Tax=Actinomadura rupiterrae TaxID=559627 RepID=UPI0020A4FE1F|nr:CocE/NonD family hydrolase [Actinomadura rupiterrae]MCP2336795.1 hypothetical protein [Actinomadura rupiterrae]
MAAITPTADTGRLSRADRRVPRHTRLARRTLRGLPEPRHAVGFEGGIDVPAADGSPLKTDHYFPLDAGDFPTLLVRTPYSRGFPWAAIFGVAFAEQGFHVVLQSARGTGGSGGTFDLWRHDAADGHAAVAWLREQEWFTGVLGTIGASAQSHATAALAQDPPPELRASVALVPLHDPHAFLYTGGVFNLENALIASTTLAHEGRMTPAHVAALVRLARRLRKGVRPDEITEPPFLRDAIAHPDPADPHWTGARVTPRVPTCLVSGWQDVTLDQAVREYESLREAGIAARLVIGPWTHSSALSRGLPEVFDAALAWLRTHLTGETPAPGKPLRLHIADTWRDLDTWPAPPEPARTDEPEPPATSREPAHPARQRDSRRNTTPRDPAVPPVQTGAQVSATARGQVVRVDSRGPGLPATLRHDPGRPPASVGGALLSSRGGVREDRRGARHGGALAFESAPLDEPLEVVGAVGVRLRISGNGVIFVRLSDVDERGRSRNVSDGVVRTNGGEAVVPLATTGHRFAAGHQVRVVVSGPPHPRYAKGGATTFTVAAPPEIVY